MAKRSDNRNLPLDERPHPFPSKQNGLDRGSSAPQNRKQLTFVNEILGLQVKTLAMTLSPQTGDRGVELAATVRLHGRRRSWSVPLHARLCRFPLIALWRHLERQVVIWDVNVSGIVTLVCVVLTALAMPPSIRLVPVIGADGYNQQDQSANRQEKPRAG